MEDLFENTWKQVLSWIENHDVAIVGAFREKVCDMHNIGHTVLKNCGLGFHIDLQGNMERMGWLKNLLLQWRYDIVGLHKTDLHCFERILVDGEPSRVVLGVEECFLVVNAADKPGFKKDMFVASELFNQDGFLFKGKGQLPLLIGTNDSNHPGYGVEVAADSFLSQLEHHVRTRIANANYAYNGGLLERLEKEQKTRELNKQRLMIERELYYDAFEKYSGNPNIRGSWGRCLASAESGFWNPFVGWDDRMFNMVRQQVLRCSNDWQRMQPNGGLAFIHNDTELPRNTSFLSESNKVYLQYQEAYPRNMLYVFRPDFVNNAHWVDVRQDEVQRLIEDRGENGYVVLSPCCFLRGEARPDIGFSDFLQEMHEQRETFMFSGLVEDLAKEGMSFTPVYGVYMKDQGKGNEKRIVKPAVVVYNRRKDGNDFGLDKLFELAVRYAEDYIQGFFVFKAPRQNARLIFFDRTFDRDLGVRFVDCAKTYFEMLYGFIKNPEYFSFSAWGYVYAGCFVNPVPQSAAERDERKALGEVFLEGNK